MKNSEYNREGGKAPIQMQLLKSNQRDMHSHWIVTIWNSTLINVTYLCRAIGMSIYMYPHQGWSGQNLGGQGG